MTTFTRVTDLVEDNLATYHNELIDGLQAIPGPNGWLENGYIVVTVASNNITVAIKTKAGIDPSVLDPVTIHLGTTGTKRQITAALSVTKNAGTDWFASGSVLAAQEVDYFVYIGYNATDGVVIGFSPFPAGYVYSDFSVTSTNAKYCAISTITNAAASDPYVVIGRFAASLSAAASFNWSVPTFTASNLIQYPIRNTRELSWVPIWTGLTIGNAVVTAKYVRRETKVEYHLEVVFGNTTAVTGDVICSLPVTQGTYGAISTPTTARYISAGGGFLGVGILTSTTTMTFKVSNASGTYLASTTLSSTIPATWTTNDVIQIQGFYFGA